MTSSEPKHPVKTKDPPAKQAPNHPSDGGPSKGPLQRLRRTDHKGHWEWSVKRNRTLFEDTVYGILDGFHQEKGGPYMLDESVFVNGAGWQAHTALEIWAYWRPSKKPDDPDQEPPPPKNARYLRSVLVEYLEWGLSELGKARIPVIPNMPEFADFLQQRSRKKPVK